jgi:hypothetical protein
MRRLSMAILALAWISMACVAQAQDKPNPTGTWKWKVEFRGQSFEATLKLKLEGDTLSGAMVGRNGREMPISEATYKDGDLAFKVVRERNGQKMTQKFTGKVSGDTIKGKIEVDRNGQTQSHDWEAKRAS